MAYFFPSLRENREEGGGGKGEGGKRKKKPSNASTPAAIAAIKEGGGESQEKEEEKECHYSSSGIRRYSPDTELPKGKKRGKKDAGPSHKLQSFPHTEFTNKKKKSKRGREAHTTRDCISSASGRQPWSIFRKKKGRGKGEKTRTAPTSNSSLRRGKKREKKKGRKEEKEEELFTWSARECWRFLQHHCLTKKRREKEEPLLLI